MLLNEKQKEYLFKVWFEDKYDLLKIFETTDVEYLCKQEIVMELDFDFKPWQKVIVNGYHYTTVNTEIHDKEWEVLIDL